MAISYIHTQPAQTIWWYTPLLSGIFALIGVSIAQLIVLRLAHKNDLRRSEPELLKQCAEFSAACGRLKERSPLRNPEIETCHASIG